jgi:hypothetical protein
VLSQCLQESPSVLFDMVYNLLIDLACLVKLVDPSCPTGFNCMMFSREEKLLPQIRAEGDILRIHRIKVDL